MKKMKAEIKKNVNMPVSPDPLPQIRGRRCPFLRNTLLPVRSGSAQCRSRSSARRRHIDSVGERPYLCRCPGPAARLYRSSFPGSSHKRQGDRCPGILHNHPKFFPSQRQFRCRYSDSAFAKTSFLKNKTYPETIFSGRFSLGTPDAIRTHDLQSRSLTLYPAELQAHRQQ